MTRKTIKHHPTFLFLLLLVTPKQSLLHHNMNVVLDVDEQQESSLKTRASECCCDKDLVTKMRSQQPNGKCDHNWSIALVRDIRERRDKKTFVSSNLESPEDDVTREKNIL